MKRRGFLATAGLGAASGLAGCSVLGGSSSGDAPFEHPGTIDESFATNGEYPTDDDPADGMPPEFSDAPPEPDVEPSSFETLSVNEETVRLVPIDVASAWYRRRDARFVDARGLGQYEETHVYGSVLSTAQKGSTGGGIDGWPEDDRVVTYCGCPHHLSSMRASGLQKAGYSRVFAIDEGFVEWFERDYPMAGTRFRSDTRSEGSEWVLEGAVDPGHAGAYAWASVERQYEAAPIRTDGTYTLTVRFSSVTGDTPVQVTTPSFTVTSPLGELADNGVPAP